MGQGGGSILNGVRRRARAGVFPRLYAVRIVFGVLPQVLLILLLIEGIFLAEELVHVLESILGSRVGKHAETWDVVSMLLYRAPRVFDLALPIAVLVAVYRVMLRCREDRELMVLASTGIGVHKLISLMATIGICAQIISLCVSGMVDPLARFAQRGVLFEVEYRTLRGGPGAGQIHHFPRHVVFAVPSERKSSQRPLFIHQELPAAQNQLISAERSRLEGPDKDGNLKLHLADFATYLFFDRFKQDSADTGPQNHGNPVSRMRIGDYAQELTLDQLLRFDPRGISLAEWTTTELLGIAPQLGPRNAHHSGEIGARFVRSVLCLIAPLLAMLAVVFTTRGSQAFALPVACAFLMCLELGGSAAAKLLAPAGDVVVLLVLSGAAALMMIVLAMRTLANQHAIIRPALS
jgi:lipopolysaccharide export LptBFGC system permease protein LptF